MTTLNELMDLTMEVTKRPDLVSRTATAIRLAILRAHQTDFFKADEKIHVLNYTVSNTRVFDEVTSFYSVVSRMRSPSFIQVLDASNLAFVEKLEYEEESNILDSYGTYKGGKFTVAGGTLRLYAFNRTGRADLFYYQNPNVSEAGFASWIADMYPDECATWAAAILFNRLGHQEQAKLLLEQEVQPFRELLQEAHLLNEVH